MAIKVQVKETGTSKVQPNLFSNGANMGMGATDFIGMQPTFGGAFGAWNTPAYNAWNMPFAGMNSLYGNTTANYSANTLPWARQNAFIGQLPGMWQGEFMNPLAASAASVNPWMFGLAGQSSNLMNGFNRLGLSSTGTAALAQQAAITGQPVVDHLPIDLLDDGSQYLLVADLPGVKIDDLELTIENGHLVIKAVAQSTTFVPGIDITTPVATIAREKAPVKVYQRAFAIGRDVTVEAITASITNGVLTISLPKVNVMTGTPSRMRNTVAAVA